MSTSIPTVADYMTPGAHSITAHEPILKGKAMMREHGIRHLPVLSDEPSELGKLVGIVSDRDLTRARAIADHPNQFTIEEAMTTSPYVVAPGAPLTRVARELAEHKFGSAIVMEGQSIVGVLTTTDALVALADILEGKALRRAYDVGPPQSPPKRPRQERK